MNNPRDFIPAKYKKNQTKEIDAESVDFQSAPIDFQRNEKAKETIDSPWSDLAKEPEIPEYRNTSDFGEEKIDNYKQTSDVVPTLSNSSSVADSLSLEDNSPIAANLANNFKPKKKSNTKLAGLLVVFFLIVGIFSSYLLSKQNQDNRQQASITDPYEDGSLIVGCVSGYYACNVGCCGTGGTPTEGKRYSPILGTGVTWNSFDDISTLANADAIKEAIRVELKSRGLLNDNGTIRLTENYTTENYFDSPNGKAIYDYCYPGGSLDTSKCSLVTGGYLYVGGSRAGDPCAPILTGGGDWCQVIGGESALCEDLGLIRCACSNGIGVIGSSGQSCDNLCGGTNNICESCDPPEEPNNPPTGTPTNPPTGTPTITTTPPPGSLVCSSIEMLDASNNTMTADDDKNLKNGDEVRFRCSSSGDTNIEVSYEFRLWAPNSNYWLNITDSSGTVADNISAAYIIVNSGRHVAQARICTTKRCSSSSPYCSGDGTVECQAWETVDGSPSTPSVSDSCYGAGATPCQTGYVCSAIPAGGCPTTTVNGITESTICASAPFCRQAEGINCQSNSDCFDGYSCYQPPMPTCPTGMSCAQVMPAKYCKIN